MLSGLQEDSDPFSMTFRLSRHTYGFDLRVDPHRVILAHARRKAGQEEIPVIETPTFPGVRVLLPLQRAGGIASSSRLEVRFTRPVKFIVRQFGASRSRIS